MAAIKVEYENVYGFDPAKDTHLELWCQAHTAKQQELEEVFGIKEEVESYSGYVGIDEPEDEILYSDEECYFNPFGRLVYGF